MGSPEAGTIIVCSQEWRQRVILSSWFGLRTSSRSMKGISNVKKALGATFHIVVRWRLHWFMGQIIRWGDGKFTVNQKRYIETVIEWFQKDQRKHSRTPADFNLKLQSAQNGHEEIHQRISRSLVRSLLYLTNQTRPGMLFTVNICNVCDVFKVQKF